MNYVNITSNEKMKIIKTVIEMFLHRTKSH